MRSNRSTAACTAASASAGLVTSSLTTCRSSWAPPRARSTASGRRPVATTALPAASAALAMSTPIPRPAPVTIQTFLSVSDIDVLLYGWALHARQHLARQHLLSRSQPFANALARSWSRPVTYGPPAMNGGRHARALAAVSPLFTQVRGIRILRSSRLQAPRPAPALYQSGRGSATFSPLPRP